MNDNEWMNEFVGMNGQIMQTKTNRNMKHQKFLQSNFCQKNCESVFGQSNFYLKIKIPCIG